MMKTWTIRIILLIVGLFVVMKASGADNRLDGLVTVESGQPVYGASVVLSAADSIVTGTATDTAGRFSLRLPENLANCTLSVTAIGYEPILRSLEGNNIPGDQVFSLTPTAHPVSPIRVTSSLAEEPSTLAITAEQVSHRAARSPVPSNITSALVAPSVTRAGSVHSSKLRIHGTSPDYFINGINVGRDPNHFGAFSIIPAAVVDHVKLQPRGASAEFDQSAAVALRTREAFGEPLSGTYSLSLIETNGSLALGNERFFVLGSLRKSVLDKLVQYLDLRSDRRTIPPTNFQDIFLSTGWRPTDRTRLIIDQYHVRDYLSFVVDGSARNSDGIGIAQHAAEHMVAARLEYLGDRTMHRLAVSVRTGVEQYHANPVQAAVAASVGDFSLRLEETATWAQADYRLQLHSGRHTWSAGLQGRGTPRRRYTMRQSNWNFTPPDAVSDVPFVYQRELNQLYGESEGFLDGLDLAAFVEHEHDAENVRRRIGVRLERFDHLEQNLVPTFRARLWVRTSERSSIELFAGSFAASPLDRILQPYQVAVRDQFVRLSPIRTHLLSAQFHYGSVKLALFAKGMENLPVVSPDFAAVSENGEVTEDFIRMTSSGSARFVGADLTVEQNDILNGKFDFYAFYSFVHARQIKEGIETPGDLSAPHRFVARVDCNLNRSFSLGLSVAARSGNAYTDYADLDDLDESERLTRQYYRDYLSRENGQRFPAHLSLDLHAAYSFGRSQLFFNLANATDHANAIVNASDGYVYDSGILPTLGYRLSF